MSSLKAGTPAPAFELPASTGGTVALAALRGRPVVLFFYPKDDTPGCTIEACAFRDLSGDFAQAGAAVFGVSADPLESHAKFIAKHGLTTPLLSDTGHAMLTAYGVWGEKKNYGRTYMGITRTTVLIAADGTVAKVWPKVQIEGHAQDVLSAVKAMG